MMKCLKSLFAVICCSLLFTAFAQAKTEFEAPNALIERVSGEVLNLLKNDTVLRSGNIDRAIEVVDEKLMPYLNFRRMVAMAIGPKWREATPEQKDQLQNEFEMMLIRTYSGALDQVDQNVTIVMRPFRAAASAKDVTVNTEIRGHGNPIELSYRLRLEADGWKVYNINVAGVWMVENYRSQFMPQLNSVGIDGLIKALQEHNVQNNNGSK